MNPDAKDPVPSVTTIAYVVTLAASLAAAARSRTRRGLLAPFIAALIVAVSEWLRRRRRRLEPPGSARHIGLSLDHGVSAGHASTPRTKLNSVLSGSANKWSTFMCHFQAEAAMEARHVQVELEAIVVSELEAQLPPAQVRVTVTLYAPLHTHTHTHCASSPTTDVFSMLLDRASPRSWMWMTCRTCAK